MSDSAAALLDKPVKDMTDAELAAAKASLRRPSRPPVPAGSPDGLLIRNMESVIPQPLKWLWPGVLPLGKLSMIVGDPGLGKSLLTLDVAARVSQGAASPDGSHNVIGEVILLSAEDDPSDTIRPRLDAAGALPSLIQFVEAVTEGKRQRGFNLTADVARLDRAIGENTRLVIVDPITAYLGAIDSHVTSDVRGVLAPLAELAARRSVAIVGVSHLNKGSSAAMYRVTGSLAFVAAARAVWAVGRDPQDAGRILMLPVKMNLAPNEGGFAYRVSVCEGTMITAPHVVWEPGRIQGDADEMLQAGRDSEDHSEKVEAREWLAEVLAAGPVAQADLRRAATEAGLSWATVRRAKKTAGAVSEKSGFSGGWTWTLAPKALKSAEDAHPQSKSNLGQSEHLRAFPGRIEI